MAKTVKINNVTYESVPQVSIPLSSGTGNANYYDTTGATAAASDILQGKTAFLNAGQSTGSMPNNGAIAGEISKKTEFIPWPPGIIMEQEPYRSAKPNRPNW